MRISQHRIKVIYSSTCISQGKEKKYEVRAGYWRRVVSGLGKGVTASSIGLLLKSCGFRVTSIKIDPYLNTDAGTMSPFEHGEVFVLDDGGEVDLDLGNYERFLDITLTRDNNITTGKIYQYVINKERKGDYLGKTVQVVPHITDAIQEWIERAALIPVDGKEGPADICVIELGGTIGTFTSRVCLCCISFLFFFLFCFLLATFLVQGTLNLCHYEALGQFSYRVGTGNFCLVHVSLVPVLNVVGEQKTKPTQHSVRGLRGLGLTPNILACRSTMALDENVKEKLSRFCHVPDQKAHEALLKELNLLGIARKPDLTEWTARTKVYDMLHDPALLHASVGCRKKLVVEWVEASHLEDITAKEGADGILVPGGFGDRGVQGKILAAKYARESKVPFLGICLGMQIAVVEYARSVLGLYDANTEEFDPQTSNPCVIFMPEVLKLIWEEQCVLDQGGLTSRYGDATFVDERHRHRYEVNPDMISQLEAAGLSFVGRDESGRRMEIVELPSHPYFIGVQFHPEFKSRPGKPSALFSGLIAASCGQMDLLLNKSDHLSNGMANGINGKATSRPRANGNSFQVIQRIIKWCIQQW
ncbi:hypothetical protein CXB51_034517 [Gossypium anomalum]|uniref:CTP synthase n=1 Tax=Gossypium anomalum TaxID=47600 RepID=A0A8J5XMY3_9ROSI|nr:hypothetical protein CXB51_034517 [Gossypium anomalum]